MADKNENGSEDPILVSEFLRDIHHVSSSLIAHPKLGLDPRQEVAVADGERLPSKSATMPRRREGNN
jgi:hypothetical protein